MLLFHILKNNSSGVNAPMLDTHFLNLFPMKNESELYDVEQKLRLKNTMLNLSVV